MRCTRQWRRCRRSWLCRWCDSRWRTGDRGCRRYPRHPHRRLARPCRRRCGGRCSGSCPSSLFSASFPGSGLSSNAHLCRGTVCRRSDSQTHFSFASWLLFPGGQVGPDRAGRMPSRQPPIRTVDASNDQIGVRPRLPPLMRGLRRNALGLHDGNRRSPYSPRKTSPLPCERGRLSPAHRTTGTVRAIPLRLLSHLLAKRISSAHDARQAGTTPLGSGGQGRRQKMRKTTHVLRPPIPNTGSRRGIRHANEGELPMDTDRFDALTRTLSTPRSRRGALGGVLAGGWAPS